MNASLHLKDEVKIIDTCSLCDNNKKDIITRMSGGPVGTRVIFKNHDTGEILGEYHNKVVITGSQFNAMSVFGIKDPLVTFPSYNKEMNLDYKSTKPEPLNTPIVCLFCVSDSGCGEKPQDIFVSSYTDRIKPAPANPSSISEFTSDMIMPFRFVDANKDISDDLRNYYFGKKTFDKLGKIGYYFKKFDTDPQLHLRYADGTQITDNIYNINTEQSAECYVEMRLRITRLDFRDYFESVLGWDKARISSMSLCFAWYDNTIDQYVYFQDITPYTILNFNYQWLVDLDTAIDILYQIYY